MLHRRRRRIEDLRLQLSKRGESIKNLPAGSAAHQLLVEECDLIAERMRKLRGHDDFNSLFSVVGIFTGMFLVLFSSGVLEVVGWIFFIVMLRGSHAD
ncbi:hypothetical protein [Streptomyces olivoreticuli]|uniref:hypothetical protein n=1 Tax=Streptomyces olivoreticuli TaxID=68246 RepID=UPI0013C35FB2|nr:hypothetical protein [Streptomyces olivoreticuli]